MSCNSYSLMNAKIKEEKKEDKHSYDEGNNSLNAVKNTLGVNHSV